MLGTVLIGYAWHGMEMLKLRTQNESVENDVRANIVKLTAYRDQLKAHASSTIKTIPQ
jgi:CCR4-NOT transcriptional regulation complex NOT5 subunit